MDTQKQSAIDRIKQANNVLVTVNSNPTVDQLAACIGLTLMLNSLGKHGTAVFSGAVPSTIEFLEPEKTLEKNTDSLRDFIISLDKSKADKLRYKVEDTVVKIFITPYRTSISDKDLEFSQGDFNVDVIVALGVHEQKELDQAIIAHGRILHDATIISINTQPGNNLGTINWQDPGASSLSEMVASLADSFEKKVMDNQVATALLTGIVAETERFSNDKTSPNTMKFSAQLMAAGANQQLVATKLQEPPSAPPPEPAGQRNPPGEPPKPGDGTLQINHAGNGEPQNGPVNDNKPFDEGQSKYMSSRDSQIHVDDTGQMSNLNDGRQLLTGPGPNDASSVLPSLEETEQPSGMPNKMQDFGYAPQSMEQLLSGESKPGENPADVKPKEENGPAAAPPPPESPAPEPSQGTASQSSPSEPGSSPTAPPPFADVASPPMPSATSIPDADLTPFGVSPSSGASGPLQPIDRSAPLPPPPPPPPPPVPVPPPPSPMPPPPPPEPPKQMLPSDNEKLADLEKELNSPHLQQPEDSPQQKQALAGGPDESDARDEVEKAADSGQPPEPTPIEALNAQPFDGALHDDDQKGDDKSDDHDEHKDEDKHDEHKEENHDEDSHEEPEHEEVKVEPIEEPKEEKHEEPKPEEPKDEPDDDKPLTEVGTLAEPLPIEEIKEDKVDKKDEKKDDKPPSSTPNLPLPEPLMPPPADSKPPTSSDNDNPAPPPPVPPPMMPIQPT